MPIRDKKKVIRIKKSTYAEFLLVVFIVLFTLSSVLATDGSTINTAATTFNNDSDFNFSCTTIIDSGNYFINATYLYLGTSSTWALQQTNGSAVENNTAFQFNVMSWLGGNNTYKVACAFSSNSSALNFSSNITFTEDMQKPAVSLVRVNGTNTAVRTHVATRGHTVNLSFIGQENHTSSLNYTLYINQQENISGVIAVTPLLPFGLNLTNESGGGPFAVGSYNLTLQLLDQAGNYFNSTKINLTVFDTFAVNVTRFSTVKKTFNYASGINIDFEIAGPPVVQFGGFGVAGTNGYGPCTIALNTSRDVRASGVYPDYSAVQSNVSFADAGTNTCFSEGGLCGQHSPFILKFEPNGTIYGADVNYTVSCVDPSTNLTVTSTSGNFTLDLGGNAFFDPANVNFSMGGQAFTFSQFPFFLGDDLFENDTYSGDVDLRGLFTKDGPYIVQGVALGGSRYNSPGCENNPYSCTNYSGTKTTPRCSGNESSVVDTQFYFYLDVDGNVSTGCNVTSTERTTTGNTLNDTFSGFEYAFFANYSTTSGNPEVRVCNVSMAFADPSTTNLNITSRDIDNQSYYNVTTLVTTQFDTDRGCNEGTVGISIQDSNFSVFFPAARNSSNKRWFVKSRNSSDWQDSFHKPVVFTEGTADFIPFEPAKCGFGSKNTSDKTYDATNNVTGAGGTVNLCDIFNPAIGPGFLNGSFFEDCFNNRDDDGDGLADAADGDCSFLPGFSGSDTAAPKTLFSKALSFNDRFVIKWSVSEPSNGSIQFFNRNSSCQQVNQTLSDDSIPGSSFDDFKPFHDVIVSPSKLGVSGLVANVTYYYKIVDKDKQNNTAASNCLGVNLTATVDQSGNLTANKVINFTAPTQAGAFFDARFKINYGAGFQNFDAGSTAHQGGTGVDLEYAPGNGSWGFKFIGVDLQENTSVDFGSAFVVNLSAGNGSGAADKLIGMDHDKWLELVQDLGADYVEVTLPSTGDRLFKCGNDGRSNCSEITSLASVVSSTASTTTWRIGTSIGFSVLGMNGSSFQLVSDRNEYSCFPSCTIQINYTNNNSDFGAQNVTISVYNTTTNPNVTITRIQVLNLSNNRSYDITDSGSVYLPINTSGEGRPIIFNVSISMNRHTAGRLSLVFKVNGTSDGQNGTNFTAFQPYVGSVNVTAPQNASFTSNQSPLFNFTSFSDFDTNKSCNIHVDGVVVSNLTGQRGINATGTAFQFTDTLNTTSHTYFFRCNNSASEIIDSFVYTLGVDAGVGGTNASIITPNRTTNDTTPELNFTIFDDLNSNVTFQFYVNGVLNGSSNATINGTQQLINLSGLTQNGNYTVILQANDSAGHFVNSTPVLIVVDIVAPDVTFDNPAAGYNISTATPFLNFSLGDLAFGVNLSTLNVSVQNTTNVSQFMFNSSNMTCSSTSGTILNTTCTLTMPVALHNVTNSTSTIVVEYNITVRDNAQTTQDKPTDGNQLRVSSVKFNINVKPPFFNTSLGSGNDTNQSNLINISSQNITSVAEGFFITANISDNQGLDQVYLKFINATNPSFSYVVNNSDFTVTMGGFKNTSAVVNITARINDTLLGLFNVSLVMNDTFGNVNSTNGSLNFLVQVLDGHVPNITAINPLSNANVSTNTTQLQFNITDATTINTDTLAVNVEFANSAASRGAGRNFTDENVSCSANTSSLMICSISLNSGIALAEGNHSMIIRVNDTRNNTGIRNTSFTVDVTPPAISAVTNDLVIISGDVINVSVNVSDVGGHGYNGTGANTVTANGVSLNRSSFTFYFGSVTVTSANITVVATDFAGNARTAFGNTLLDEAGPDITVSSPVNGSIIRLSANGTVNVTGTVQEANLSNLSIYLDGYFKDSTATNGTFGFNLNLNNSIGNHRIVLNATDQAARVSLATIDVKIASNLNTTFINSTVLGNNSMSILNVSFKNVTVNSTGGITAKVQTLADVIDANITTERTFVANDSFATYNISAVITASGLNFNENEIYGLRFNVSPDEALANNTQIAAGGGKPLGDFKAFFLVTNMSRYLGDNFYQDASGSKLWALFTLSGYNVSNTTTAVVYMTTDVGNEMRVLSPCVNFDRATLQPLSTPSVDNACYVVNGTIGSVSAGTTFIWVPHFSGFGLMNTTNAPTLNFTSPRNSSSITVNDSFFDLSGEVFDLNLNTSSCRYNFTQGVNVLSQDAFGAAAPSKSFTPSPTITNGTNYTFSVSHLTENAFNGLSNGSRYNVTVRCASDVVPGESSGNATAHTLDFIVNDVHAPSIQSVSASSIGSSSATISAVTNEESNVSIVFGTSNTTMTSITGAGFSAAGTRSVSLTSLTASTTYFFNVTSCDFAGTTASAGNCNSTGVFSFTTSAASSSSSSSSGGGGGGGGGGGSKDTKAGTAAGVTSSHVFNVVNQGAQASLTVTRAEVAISKILFTATQKIQRGKVHITALSSDPSEAASLSAQVYQYLEILLEGMEESDVSSVTIEFKVPQEWMAENSIADNNIVLYRFEESNWNPLETRYESKAGKYNYYTAKSPGLSLYAVGTRSVAPAKPEQEVAGEEEQKPAEETTDQQEMKPVEEGTEGSTEGRQEVTSTTSYLPAIIVVLLVIVAAVVIYLMKKK